MLMLSVLSSCKRDDGQLCGNYICMAGSCVDGSCVCAAGFEGKSCESAVIEKYLGRHLGFEECVFGPGRFYEVGIIPSDTNVQVVQIQNLGNFGALVRGELKSDGSIDIPLQNMGSRFTISGTVTIADTMVSVNYALRENPPGNLNSNCTWTQRE